MDLTEIGTAIFILKSENFDLFTVEERPFEIRLEIFGVKQWINELKDNLFITVKSGRMTMHKNKAFEFNLLKEKDLNDFYKENRLETPKEKNTMFSNFKIKDVKFGEISDVALETAVEKIAGQLEGVEIKTKADKTYLIKNGKAIELKGDEFIGLVEKFVKGKTVAGLRRNKEMFTLIQNLGIISEVTLENQADDLSTIFG